jgi:hypothetical protein
MDERETEIPLDVWITVLSYCELQNISPLLFVSKSLQGTVMAVLVGEDKIDHLLKLIFNVRYVTVKLLSPYNKRRMTHSRIAYALRGDRGYHTALANLFMNVLGILHSKSKQLFTEDILSQLLLWVCYDHYPCTGKILELLLQEEKSQPQMIDNFMLLHVTESSNEDVIQLLLNDSRVNPNEDDLLGFVNAVRVGNMNIIRMFLNCERIDIAKCSSALHQAVVSGNINVAKLFLEDGRVDPSYSDNDAIITATYYGNVEMFKLLLGDKRTNPAAQHNCALVYAVNKRQYKIASILLADERVDPTVRDNYCIKYAIDKQDSEMVEILSSHHKVDKNIFL